MRLVLAAAALTSPALALVGPAPALGAGLRRPGCASIARVGRPACCDSGAAPRWEEALVSEMVRYDTDEARKAALTEVVRGWAPDARQSKSDALSAELSKRAVLVQEEGQAAHTRGESTKPAEWQLWAIVDMTFQVKLLVKRLAETNGAAWDLGAADDGDAKPAYDIVDADGKKRRDKFGFYDDDHIQLD